MAHERKRGALGALLSYLRLGENAFLEPPRFDRAYPFVLTLDAGGQLLPMISQARHPERTKTSRTSKQTILPARAEKEEP